MNLSDSLQPPGGLASGRFFRTSYLPTYAAAIFLLMLIWAGASLRPVVFHRVWQTAKHISVLDVFLLVLVVTLIAVLLQPLQLSIVRVLEGNVPAWLGSGLGRRWHSRRFRKLRKKVGDKANEAGEAAPADAGRIELEQQAGKLAATARVRYPRFEHLIRPTALGNALAAMEDTAGAAYGFDTVVIWPLLYTVLGDRIRPIVDDLRDSLDAASRLAATGVVTAVASAALLAWHSGWWTLLALLPLAIAELAYLGAVQAAIAYGGAIRIAFDLHRFDLLTALHLEMPADSMKERDANSDLSDFLRQGIPMSASYAHPDPTTPSPIV